MKNKKVIIFLLSQFISLFGSSLTQYAITWYIALETQSGLYSTIALVCGFLPTFIVSPLAGVLADKYNRKWLIVLSDLTIALATLILAICFMMGYKYYWIMFVVLAIRGAGSGVQNPAVSSLIPDITSEDMLVKVNGLFQSGQSMTSLICPVITGFLMSFCPIEYIFGIDVVTALLASIILILFLKIKVTNKREQDNMFVEFKEGLKYSFNNNQIRILITSCFFLWLIAGPLLNLLPIQVIRKFGEQVFLLTIVESVMGIGMVIGGLVMSVWSGFENKYKTLSLSLYILGGATVGIALMNVFPIYIAFIIIAAAGLAIFNTVAIALVQATCDKDYIGRVFGVISMLSSSLMPLGMAFLGPLADIISIDYILVIVALVILTVGIVLQTRTKSFVFEDKIKIEG